MIRGFQWVAAAVILGGSIIYAANSALLNKDDSKGTQSKKAAVNTEVNAAAGTTESVLSDLRRKVLSSDEPCTGTPEEIIACEQIKKGPDGPEAPYSTLDTDELALQGTANDALVDDPANDKEKDISFANTTSSNTTSANTNEQLAPQEPQRVAANEVSPQSRSLAGSTAVRSSTSNDVTSFEGSPNDKITNSLDQNKEAKEQITSSNWAAAGQQDQELAVLELATDKEGRIVSGKRVRKKRVNGKLVDKPDDSAFFTENQTLSEKPERTSSASKPSKGLVDKPDDGPFFTENSAGEKTLRQPGKALVAKPDNSPFFTENRRLDPCLREDGTVYTGPGTAQDPLALDNPCLPVEIAEFNDPAEFSDPCLADNSTGGLGAGEGTTLSTQPGAFPDGEDPCLTQQQFALATPVPAPALPDNSDVPSIVDPDPEPLPDFSDILSILDPEPQALDTPASPEPPLTTARPPRPPSLVPPLSGASYRVNG